MERCPKTGKFIKTTGSANYKRIQRSGKNMQYHRFVWEKHYGDIPEGYVIHHVNGNKKDNRLENLSCMSYSEHNKLHAKDRKIWNKGLKRKGNVILNELFKKRKITTDRKKFIKSMIIYEVYKTNDMTQQEIADYIGLSRRQICDYLQHARKIVLGVI